MAGAGAKLFTSGSVLTAAQVNTFLMDQTIMTFASTTTRDAAFGGAGEPTLAEGMFAYTTDTNTLWSYNGSSWVSVLGSDIGEISTDNRNVIINGAMQLAQRGTSTAGITTSNYYTADRFSTDLTTLGTWTQSIEADAPTGSGLRNSLKMLCTTADSSPAAADILTVSQFLEGQNVQQFAKGTASAKPFTVSFWVKANVTGTYIVNLYDTNNTRSVSNSYTILASATWEKKTITFPADTTGAFTNSNVGSLYCFFYLGAGSNYTSGTLNTTWASATNANRAVGQTNVAATLNNYWQVTGVQLEVGSVATPFEFEDFGTTLAKCQRYYFRTPTTTSQQYANIANGYMSSSSQAVITIYTTVPMRVPPHTTQSSAAATFFVNSAATGQIMSTIINSGYRSTNNSYSFVLTGPASFTAGQGCELLQDDNDTAFLAASAEL